jgi:hypothetical protein
MGSFVAMIGMTLWAATGFLAIDRFAMSAGHK